MLFTIDQNYLPYGLDKIPGTPQHLAQSTNQPQPPDTPSASQHEFQPRRPITPTITPIAENYAEDYYGYNPDEGSGFMLETVEDPYYEEDYDTQTDPNIQIASLATPQKIQQKSTSRLNPAPPTPQAASIPPASSEQAFTTPQKIQTRPMSGLVSSSVKKTSKKCIHLFLFFKIK